MRRLIVDIWLNVDNPALYDVHINGEIHEAVTLTELADLFSDKAIEAVSTLE